MVAVLAGRIDTAWLAPHGQRRRRAVHRPDVWLAQSRLSSEKKTHGCSRRCRWAHSRRGRQRPFNARCDASSDPPWSEAYVGTMAASVFMVPMAVLMAMLSSRANGLAKMATLYLHNLNFTPKAIEYLDEAIALSPRSADLYNMRGIAHSKAGDGERADADFRKVTRAGSARRGGAHEPRRRLPEAGRLRSLDRGAEARDDGQPEARDSSSAISARRIRRKVSSMPRSRATPAPSRCGRNTRSRSRTAPTRTYLKGEHDLAIADATRAIALESRLADGPRESGARARGERRCRDGGAAAIGAPSRSIPIRRSQKRRSRRCRN